MTDDEYFETTCQKNSLEEAMRSFSDYLSYATKGSHCAVPGETDSILEQMEKIYKEYFGSN